MILISSSLGRPVLTSASTPRSWKMATAAGDSLSAIRTLGMGSPCDSVELRARGARVERRHLQKGIGQAAGRMAVNALDVEHQARHGMFRFLLDRIHQLAEISAAVTFDANQRMQLPGLVERDL